MELQRTPGKQQAVGLLRELQIDHRAYILPDSFRMRKHWDWRDHQEWEQLPMPTSVPEQH